jgi:hypothetical protein
MTKIFFSLALSFLIQGSYKAQASELPRIPCGTDALIGFGLNSKVHFLQPLLSSSVNLQKLIAQETQERVDIISDKLHREIMTKQSAKKPEIFRDINQFDYILALLLISDKSADYNILLKAEVEQIIVYLEAEKELCLLEKEELKAILDRTLKDNFPKTKKYLMENGYDAIKNTLDSYLGCFKIAKRLRFDDSPQSIRLSSQEQRIETLEKDKLLLQEELATAHADVLVKKEEQEKLTKELTALTKGLCRLQKKRDLQSDLQSQIKGLKSELDEQQQKLLQQQKDSSEKEHTQARELSVATRELTCCMVELTSLREQLEKSQPAEKIQSESKISSAVRMSLEKQESKYYKIIADLRSQLQKEKADKTKLLCEKKQRQHRPKEYRPVVWVGPTERQQLCAKILQYQYMIKSFQKNICELTQALQRAHAQEQYSREIVAHHRTLCEQVVADAKKGEEQTRLLLVELQNKINLKEEEEHRE